MASADINNGSASADVRQLFDRADKNRSGMLEVEELRAVFSELGLLEGKPPAEADAFVVSQFAAADLDRDSALSLPEFEALYAKVTAPCLLDVLKQTPGQVERLRSIFLAFAAFGSRGTVKEMDGSKWLKLSKESGLVGGRGGLTPSDVDIIFAQAKEKTARKLTFAQFLDALALAAERRHEPVSRVLQRVLACGGPSVNSASAGSCAAPPAGSSASTPDMVTPSASYLASAGPGAGGGVRPRMSSTSDGPGSGLLGELDGETAAALRGVFDSFAVFGTGGGSTPSPGGPGSAAAGLGLDSKQFAKLCREGGLLGRRLSTTDVDLAFTRAKGKGGRKLAWAQFLSALADLAGRGGLEPAEAARRLAACEGPQLHGTTTPEAVRLHDDTSTYTGVYAQGGPQVDDAITPDKLFNRGRNVISITAVAAPPARAPL